MNYISKSLFNQTSLDGVLLVVHDSHSLGSINIKKMQKEIWKDVPNYDGLYRVSNFGRVKSFWYNKERLLKNTISGRGKNISGYFTVALYINGTKNHIKVSVLVAMAFLNHKPDGTHKIVVDHIDNNPLNDKVNNLQLITHRENCSKDKVGYSSRFVGVCWFKRKNKWRASIIINGASKYLGCYISELDAHKAYQKELNRLS